MNKKLLFMALFSSSVVLGGCSTSPVFDCPMGDSCAPIKDVYDSSKADKGENGWSTYKAKNTVDQDKIVYTDDCDSGLEPECFSKSTSKAKNKAKIKTEHLSITVKDALNGAVYHPAVPYQAWLAPYKDDNGSLYSGNYVWITTPAYWTYAGVNIPVTKSNSGNESDMAPAFLGNFTPPSDSNPIQKVVNSVTK